MKRLIAVLAVPLLSSCAIYDAYMMTPYDSNEYKLAVEIRTDAHKYRAQCDDADASKRNAQAIADKTQLFEFYSEHIPRNNNGASASRNLNEIAQGLLKRYNSGDKVSTTFCRLKFEGIEIGAVTLQSVLGKKPR
jgi:hypothetical protein